MLEKQNKKLISYFPTYLRPNDNMIISKYDDITWLECTYLSPHSGKMYILSIICKVWNYEPFVKVQYCLRHTVT